MTPNWKPKHSYDKFREYEVYCPDCGIHYTIFARPESELWCPMCETSDAMIVKEIAGERD